MNDEWKVQLTGQVIDRLRALAEAALQGPVTMGSLAGADLLALIDFYEGAVKTSPSVVDAMRAAGWTEHMIGAAMDAKSVSA